MNGISASAYVGADDVYTDLNALNQLKTGDKDVALKKVAQEFESIFVNTLLKNMRSANAVFEKDSLFQSNESKMYRDMYDQQLSLSLAKGKGLGIADVLYRQLKGQYQEASAPAPDALKFDPSRTVQGGASQPLDAKRASAVQNGVSASMSAASSQSQASESTQDSGATPQKSRFDSQQDFVASLLPMAKQAAKAIGINPLMMVAQAALETGWGQHVIQAAGEHSFNLFNIKADASWAGPAIGKQTLEYKDGVAVQEAARFRQYGSFEDSFKDFIDFIQRHPRYQQALEQAEDDPSFIQALHTAGYATDPNYSDKVLSVLDRVKALVDAESI